MENDPPAPMETFERWLLRCVAQAVEAGNVSADLLTELQAELAAPQETPLEPGHVAAIQHIAGLVGVPENEAAKTFAAIEAQPSVTRRLLLCSFVEVWLVEQRKAHRAEQDG